MRILRLALIVALLVGSGHAARAEWDNIPVLNPLLLMQHPPDPVLQRLAIETGSWHPQPSTGGAGSPYPYALNNPLSNTDPTGLCPPGDVPCENAMRAAGLPNWATNDNNQPDPPLSCLAKQTAAMTALCVGIGMAQPELEPVCNVLTFFLPPPTNQLKPPSQ
jgi:hypothetical protein